MMEVKPMKWWVITYDDNLDGDEGYRMQGTHEDHALARFLDSVADEWEIVDMTRYERGVEVEAIENGARVVMWIERDWRNG